MLCFRKLPVSKKIIHKRGGGYQDFTSKGFSSQSAESFVGENFYAVFQKNSSSEKLY